MVGKKAWVVTTSGDRSIRDVARDLTAAGFSVGQVLDEIGGITGAASEEIAEKLRAIPGVADVSPEDQIDIGPPDSPDTW